MQSGKRSFTIRLKVVLAVIASMTASMLAVLGLLLADEARRHTQSRVDYLRATAAVFAAAASEAAATADSAEAQRVLRGVARAPNVVYTRLTAGDGRVLAEVGGGVVLDSDVRIATNGAQSSVLQAIASGSLTVDVPVVQGGRQVGQITMVAENRDLAAHLARSSFTWALGVGIALALSLLATNRLVRGILRPLTELTRFTRNIARSNDYSQRVAFRAGDEIGVLGAGFNEMLDAIGARDSRISDLALRDGESTLPNRAALIGKISDALDPGAADGAVVVAVVGVERLVQMRSAIGYGYANAVIAQVGARLGAAQHVVAVGRLATDSIGVLIVAPNLAEARLAVHMLIELHAEPLRLDDSTVVDVTLRAGYAAAGLHADEAESLVERASIALDMAREGRHRFKAFNAAEYDDPARTLSLMSDMRNAVRAREMTLHFQPKLDLATGRIADAEALVRWRSATRGDVSPDMFIGLSEETGAIRYLTDWSVDEACSHAIQFAAIDGDFALAVNISAALLSDPHFIRMAARRVIDRKARLVFEVTETAVIHDPQAALRSLAVLAEAGIPVAIDDYGVGLSSLEYMKKIAAHELKIDKSFVTGLSDSERDRVIVRSTIQMAHSLGMKVTAEGVETAETLRHLRAMACDKVQGFLIGRAIPAPQFAALLERGAEAAAG